MYFVSILNNTFHITQYDCRPNPNRDIRDLDHLIETRMTSILCFFFVLQASGARSTV
jgi:hypothetical protein